MRIQLPSRLTYEQQCEVTIKAGMLGEAMRELPARLKEFVGAGTRSIGNNVAGRPLDLPLRCRCGYVCGVASKVSPSAGFRFVCYCHDCQAVSERSPQVRFARDSVLEGSGFELSVPLGHLHQTRP